MIQRIVEQQIATEFFKKKVIHIAGARQTGKTTLLHNLVTENNQTVLWLNGDDADTRELFVNATSTKLKELIANYTIIVIDEAQRIVNIGLGLKILVDSFPHIQVIATGSSALELADKINEPLTGRKIEYFLYPISFQEMIQYHGLLAEERLLEKRMIYGFYPEVLTTNDEITILKRLSDAYLYKDIFILENIKKPVIVEKLLQALALQIGSEVSINELSQLVGADNKTVERYIDLLEKSYIIYKLSSLSRNHRNEIKKSKKIYFYDLGIRNALIRNFNPLHLRQDVGALWENFLIVERLKSTNYGNMWANRYFWRTHAGQEVDFIEEYNGKLHAFEFKWNAKAHQKLPKQFSESYPDSEISVINKNNYLDFILYK